MIFHSMQNKALINLKRAIVFACFDALCTLWSIIVVSTLTDPSCMDLIHRSPEILYHQIAVPASNIFPRSLFDGL